MRAAGGPLGDSAVREALGVGAHPRRQSGSGAAHLAEVR